MVSLSSSPSLSLPSLPPPQLSPQPFTLALRATGAYGLPVTFSNLMHIYSAQMLSGPRGYVPGQRAVGEQVLLTVWLLHMCIGFIFSARCGTLRTGDISAITKNGE